MKIKYLSPEGVLEVEQGAMREIERRLPGNWVAYAAFQLLQRGSSLPLDLDLVILTTNRILVIELKNWSGDVEFSDGQWFHKGVSHKSPVGITSNKARVLKSTLKERYPKLTATSVESLVVLCHPQCRLIRFPEAERQLVMTLHDFCATASDAQRVKLRFPDRPTGTFVSANPIPDRQTYDNFFAFSNPQVLERRTVIHGFQQSSDTPDYQHPRAIWDEYRAEHLEFRRNKALLRKWNFQNIAGGGTTAAERATIGLREMRLNEALRAQAPGLHIDLLEPAASATAEDVTTNFIEAYRLPDRIERVAELLARRAKMPLDERVGLARSVLARFSKLHTLGIAHRDITTKTLWVIEPARVILSTFAAARVPEGRTVGVHRVELETGSIALPEDSEAQKPTSADAALARDVFLLGSLIFEMLEGKPLEYVNGVPLFDDKQDLAIASLRYWFQTAIDWDPSKRFRSASEALDAFNVALTEDIGPVVTENDFEAFKTDASPLNLPMRHALSSSPGKSVYISEREGVKILVKCWPGLRFDVKHPTRNARVLDFLHQARSLRQSAFDASPEVIDFGMSAFGLMLVTRWEEGDSITSWMETRPTARACAELALSLLNAVRRLHALGLTHGDLKSENLAVTNSIAAGVGVILLDVPDLSADGDSCMTVGALPSYLEAATPQHRDLVTAVRLAIPLLSEVDFPKSWTEANRAASVLESMPPIDLLAETIQSELEPRAASIASFDVLLRRRSREPVPKAEMEGDNGSFPVSALLSPDGRLITFFVTGLRQQIIVKFDIATLGVEEVFSKDIGHEMYVVAAKRSRFKLHASIQIEQGSGVDASELAGVLYSRFLATRPDVTESGNGITGSVGDPYLIDGTTLIPPAEVAAAKLWGALADTDELNAARVTLRSGARKVPDGQGQWLIPFDLDEGVLDFAQEERVELMERGNDPIHGTERWYTVGNVSADIGKDLMRVTPTSSKFSPRENRVLYLRGSLERYASELRVAGMRRVLANGALIPKIPEYFDPAIVVEPKHFSHTSIENLDEYNLNPEQKEALQNCLSTGPISMLQGPPGTGKTKFIASFVHLALSKGLAKNILLVSQSHEAVNNALEKVLELSERGRMDVSMVRVGSRSMVSPLLQPMHEDARRQLYRESFDAEQKQRVQVVGYEMGLPKPYVDAAVDLHIGLGSVLDRITELERQSSSDKAAKSDNSAMHVERLREVFCELALARFELEISPRDNLDEAYRSILTQLAAENQSPSPENCRRLGVVVRLSLEFSRVLRNPRCNFTSFLCRSASVVAGTCVGVGKHAFGIVDHSYDWVIVDEAAKASPMELVVAMQAGRRVLLVGDHLQLPPIYPISVEEKTSQALQISRAEFRKLNNFKRAFSSLYGQRVGRTLLLQYRMAKSINKLVSNCFYGGALQVARQPPGDEYAYLPGYLAKQLVWIDTADQSRDAFHRAAGGHEGSLVNETEANIIVSIVRDIAKSPMFLATLKQTSSGEAHAVGIITMYAAQRDLIRRKLDQADWAADIRKVYTVGTVDSYQGKENRIILCSIVRNDTSRGIGFLADQERINVALSRAKDRLVIVGSSSMWSGRADAPMKRVLDEFRNIERDEGAETVMSLHFKSEASYA